MLEATKQKAAGEFQAAVSKASQQAVQDLEAAKQEATKARNLPEANAITAAIDQAKADITPQPKAPVGDWQVSFGNTLRAFRFDADGTVSTLDDPKPVPVGQLTQSGNAWMFTEPQVVRRRKLYLTDDCLSARRELQFADR